MPFDTIVLVDKPLPGQETLFRPVNDFAKNTPALHEFFKLYAVDGVVIFGALLLVSWWLARRDGDLRRVTASLWAPIGAAIAIGINQPLGHLFHEPRPYAVMSNVEVLVSRTHDFAFPSDHAVMAGAVACGVLLVNRRLGIATALLALLMAFARVYVGAHYPLDVVAGLIVGALVTWLGYLLLRRAGEALVIRLAQLPVVRWGTGPVTQTMPDPQVS